MNITARNTKVKRRSMTRVRAELVRKLRMFFQFTHPRDRIADAPPPGNRPSAKPAGGGTGARQVRHRCGWWCVRKQIGSAGCPGRSRRRKIATKTYDQHVEGAQGPVHQHLVDDHLEEKAARPERKAAGRTTRPETSLRRCRYLWIAPRNQVMSNRRVISDNPARRVIRISRPSQTARSSSRVIKAGRGASGD